LIGSMAGAIALLLGFDVVNVDVNRRNVWDCDG